MVVGDEQFHLTSKVEILLSILIFGSYGSAFFPCVGVLGHQGESRLGLYHCTFGLRIQEGYGHGYGRRHGHGMRKMVYSPTGRSMVFQGCMIPR